MMFERRVQSNMPAITGALRGNRDVRVKPFGSRRWYPSDVYHQLIKLSWPRLAALFILTFSAFNLFLAYLYSLDPNGIDWAGTRISGPALWRSFLFSIDTVATIGYGNMYALSVFTNVLVVIEIACGILFFALVTGIFFARISRPTARVVFSNVAVICELDGVPTLMFRAANQRHNLMFDARVGVSLVKDELVGGTTFRLFRDLTLERSATPVFMLTWTFMHRISPDSPLAPYLRTGQLPSDVEILVVLSGKDERSGQTIHARWAYRPADIRWNSRFEDIIDVLPDGTRTIDYRRFHSVKDVPGRSAGASPLNAGSSLIRGVGQRPRRTAFDREPEDREGLGDMRRNPQLVALPHFASGWKPPRVDKHDTFVITRASDGIGAFDLAVSANAIAPVYRHTSRLLDSLSVSGNSP